MMRPALLLLLSVVLLSACSRRQYALFTSQKKAVRSSPILESGSVASVYITASDTIGGLLPSPLEIQLRQPKVDMESTRPSQLHKTHTLAAPSDLKRLSFAPKQPISLTDEWPNEPKRGSGTINALSLIFAMASMFNLAGLVLMDVWFYNSFLDYYFLITYIPYMLAGLILGIIGQFGYRRRKWMGVFGIILSLMSIGFLAAATLFFL